MKKKLSIVLIVLIHTILLTSCVDNSTRIHGKLSSDVSDKKIILSQINVDIAESNVDNEKVFNFSLDSLKKGYYDLNGRIIYLAPGFNINFSNLNFNDTIFNITGKGAEENKLLITRMQEEFKYHPQAKDMLATYQEYELEPYRLYLSDLEQELNANLNNKNLDADFVASEKIRTKKLLSALLFQYRISHGIDFSVERLSEKYLMSLTPDQFKDPDVIEEYKRLAAIDNKDCLPRDVIQQIEEEVFEDFNWNDEELYSMHSLGYDLLYDQKIMTEGYKLSHAGNHSSFEINKRDVVLNKITSKPIRMIQLTQRTELIIKVSPEDAEGAYTVFLEQNPNEKQKKLVEATYKNYKNVVVGKPSAKFVNYKTPENKQVDLNDLLGKYVYIDVWATWCGPCKNEIPHLKKLEEKYHGKNIEFVSISVDTENNRNKWRKMVLDMQLKGIQLMADKSFNSDFIKAYNIASIPRFILIDPLGNLISADAKRPSDKGLIELFDSFGI